MQALTDCQETDRSPTTGRYRRVCFGPPSEGPPDCSSPPGCGKSTIAYPLVSRVNALLGGDEAAICISLDGWHYSRAELDRMTDPVEAHWRRVGPDTL